MRQVQNFIREQKMIMPGDFVIAGVSGGADSVCLFFELLAYQKEIPFSMEVVHIEHGIRGQDSLADANYVENRRQKRAAGQTARLPLPIIWMTRQRRS